MARVYQETRSRRKSEDEKIARLEDAIRDGSVSDLRSYRRWVLEHVQWKGKPLDVDDYSFPEFLIDLNTRMGLETPAYHRGILSPKEIALGLAERPIHSPGIAMFLEATNDAHRRMLQAYRGTGKTHIICAYATWLLMRDPCDTILIIRDVYKMSRFINKQIKNLLEKFPPLQHLVARVPRTWGKTEIEVSRWFTRPEPSVGCTSAKSGFTGFRGRLILCDDLETATNCYTEEQREEIRAIVDQLNLVGADLLFIGTPHTVETIYDVLIQIEQFEYQKYPVWLDEKAGITQNPHVKLNRVQQDADWVAAQRQRLAGRVFRSQLLLEPSDVTQSRIPFELHHRFTGEIRTERSAYKNRRETWINEHQIVELKAYWDSGFGDLKNDASVLRVVGRSEDNNVFVFECLTLPKVDEEKTFQEQCERIIETLGKYQLDRVIVETNFSSALKGALIRVANDWKPKAKRINITEHQRRAGYGGKPGFIRAMLEPLFNSRTIWIHETVLAERKLEREARGFPKGKKDDHLDATAGAVRFLRLKRTHPGGRTPEGLSGVIGLQRTRLNKYEPFRRKSA